MPPPPYILCLVRGGKESKRTVTKAIDIALETDARLVFFHVIDVEFLSQSMMGTRLRVAYQALYEMSDFAMDILKDRAERRGVKEVETLLREGNILKELKKAAAETQATLLVIGRPIPSPGSNIFENDELLTFAKELAEMGNLEVIVVGDEET